MNSERDCPPEVWTHPSIEVRPSPVEGHGLFASAPIDADVIVMRLGGQLVTLPELQQIFADAPTDQYVDTFAVDDDLHIVLPPGSIAHYGNHHCDPTIWPTGAFELATRRALSAGDELTIDYGLISDDPAFRLECACGATTCRGVITGEDWRIPELRVRYVGHWPPGLQHQIDRAT